MSTLLSDIIQFCERANLSESKFGELAVNDRKFVAQVRTGRDLRMSTVEKVRRFIAEYRPEAA